MRIDIEISPPLRVDVPVGTAPRRFSVGTPEAAAQAVAELLDTGAPYEIKVRRRGRFRGMIAGRWIYGDLTPFRTCPGAQIIEPSGLKTWVYPDTVCQSAEIEDRNNREIFEDDIVLTPEGRLTVAWSEKDRRLEFRGDDGRSRPLDSFGRDDIQVVGDLFETRRDPG